VTPCDMSGRPLGEWVEGQAQFANAAETKRVGQLLTRKYGLQKVMFELASKFNRTKWAVIAIRV
jgi:hypothetical protein